ncbi:MAG: DNA methyltransferase, partial [candidate division Zixibacteria bacterium]|nr:DNA methyltransferase [candidate division Zixibacteria bacterium]
RSLNIILKEHFDRPDGFASDSVTVLDPAAGTLTFLAEASKLAVQEFAAKYGEGGKESFIKEHILKNFYAFELMMAPYAIGHVKMALLLEELGYKLGEDERFRFYLTNTLEMEELEQTALPGMSSLAEESHLAGKVKREKPILVILGNPPYSGHSSNVGEWISKEIKTYYKVDGKPLGERNPKWLQDDYVKFIRFAQWKIDQAGEGVLGFITNHSYLDNPTFRGMRQSLMNSFNQIYVLDLHGNSLKKERCPDGSKDENVFDIRQGVAISFFIKKKGLERKVFHSERWGLREDKYNWLLENDIETTNWQELKPKTEFYLFIPREEAFLESYNKYPRITDIFPVNSVGVVTSRDNFVIDFDRQDLVGRIKVFRDKELSDEAIFQAFGLKDKVNWKLTKSREGVSKDEKWEEVITQILYRPFDIRWIFYHDEVIERSRKEVMRHMMKENLGLLVKRQGKRSPYSYLFCCNLIAESCVFESAFANNTVCPLYLYPGKGDMFIQEEAQERKPNLNPKLVESLTEAYGKEPIPEEIFYYMYGVLYSNIYRSKYAEFLKIDFPRVPFTKDYELFNTIGKYGSKLVELHSLKSAELNNPIAKFQGSGDYQVNEPKYNEKEKRVYINDDQYFEGIEKEVWEYQIGGYQVLDKWLKDRKGRQLSLENIKHYCQIATALEKTIEIQRDIDNIYLDIEV